MHTEEWVSLVLLRTTREFRTGEWIFLVLLRTVRGMCRCQNSHFTEELTGRQRLVNTLDDPYDSSTRNGALSSSRCRKSLSVSNDMHGSTTTREYIRRSVRLVRVDKSALRVDTSRQYWTTLDCTTRATILVMGVSSFHWKFAFKIDHD